MKKLLVVLLLTLLVALSAKPVLADNQADDVACWGQASAVYAATGEMGAHASAQETPRHGLRNLARYLYEMGAIEDDSMQALGAYVVSLDPNLTVEACME